jgi:hypothetical protein
MRRREVIVQKFGGVISLTIGAEKDHSSFFEDARQCVIEELWGKHLFHLPASLFIKSYVQGHK